MTRMMNKNTPPLNWVKKPVKAPTRNTIPTLNKKYKRSSTTHMPQNPNKNNRLTTLTLKMKKSNLLTPLMNSPSISFLNNSQQIKKKKKKIPKPSHPTPT
jgi:hypothetical protein